ncbi:MAG TPA: hypothetical protein VF332_01915 [Vicinamibacterales bacterium]
MIDQGGAGNGTPSGLERLASTSPTLVFILLQQLEALGFDLPVILKQLAGAPKTDAGTATNSPAASPAPAPPPPGRV